MKTSLRNQGIILKAIRQLHWTKHVSTNFLAENDSLYLEFTLVWNLYEVKRVYKILGYSFSTYAKFSKN